MPRQPLFLLRLFRSARRFGMFGGLPITLLGIVALLSLVQAQPASAVNVYNIPPDSVPSVFQAGDILNLKTNGTLPESFTVPSTVVLNIHGGTTGANLSAIANSSVNLFSGSIGDNSGSFGMTRVSGGTVGFSFDANKGGTVVVTGGTINFNYAGRTESETILAGGSISLGFTADSGSKIGLFGSGFTLDGSPISGLNQSGDSVVVTNRTGTIAGTLADGSPISFPLSGINNISAGATISLTRHEPGDFNNNNFVTTSDYTTWKNDFNDSVATRGASADHDFSGRVSLADYTLWRDNLAGGASLVAPTTSSVVPEPSAVVLALLAIACGARRLRSQR